ncbi:hypothetical protein IAR50_001651 [Cryptococcus sp. DSM 104548]
MRVFMTNPSGFIGSYLIPVLLAAGHKITTITTSYSTAKDLKTRGIDVTRATFDDIEVLADIASKADATILSKDPLQVISAFGQALKGTNKIFMITSFILVTGDPVPCEYTRAKVPPGAAREHLALSFVNAGVRVFIVRLPPIVHGDNDSGFLWHYIRESREAGFAGYIRDGESSWPAAHVKDVVQVYKLALESTTLKAGKTLHASREWGIPFKEIACTVAKRLCLETRSISKAEAMKTSPRLAMFSALDSVAWSDWTKEWLGWKPVEKRLIKDLERSEWYFGKSGPCAPFVPANDQRAVGDDGRDC